MNPAANTAALEMIGHLVAELIIAREQPVQPNIGEKLEAVIWWDLINRRRLDLESHARALNMAPATLRRKLFREGTSWQIIADRVRHTLADQLLAQGILIDHVSDWIGFSNTTGFYRAYKLWTGETPGNYRSN